METKTEKILLRRIGNKLRALRNENNLSQFDLSIEAGIPKNQVGRIERAEINTTVITLHKIAKVFKIDIKYFFD
ncbi:helix-turn-helix domain-containing protein [Lutibacter flavus]|uniref:DNA-binding transcriptional regulator, XRE-family HTH domain n=1 Tax=Lutibacter flavus TaxID=691689 RepID=A0A238YCP5_9FLAO|nr:helix-turn-helix transcriptional regulator [Lutibacter flavus]SNR68374.1 DNA-binding transcriptional regulator, XRE-family HTH domain [Lutibacter flavus]